MSAAEARAHHRAWRRSVPRLHRELLGSVRGDRALRERLFATRELVALRELASSALPERWQERIKAGMGSAGSAAPSRDQVPPAHPLTPEMIDFFVARTRVRIDKARRVLGYEPAFSLARGMELTEAWARWAGLT